MTIISLSGRVKKVSKRRGSGRVGSDRVGSLRFKISRLGSRRFEKWRVESVKMVQNHAGRVGSSQEVRKSRGSGCVGSIGSGYLAGRVGLSPLRYGYLACQATIIRGLVWADPRIEPADSACRFAFFKTCRFFLPDDRFVVPDPTRMSE